MSLFGLDWMEAEKPRSRGERSERKKWEGWRMMPRMPEGIGNRDEGWEGEREKRVGGRGTWG